MESAPAAGGFLRPLIIVGASARALAESAHRAGWAVHAADLFRDLDLVAVAHEAVRVTSVHDGGAGYPEGLADAATGFPISAPWCYTGGLENHPCVIAALAAARPLAGNPADVVGRIRDPALLAGAVATAGLVFPATLASPTGLPTDGSYLIKPLASAGGRAIRLWTAAAAAAWTPHRAAAAPAGHRWQRFVTGTPISAGYVMSAGSSRLLGVTRQLVGTAWCHAPRFTWCGGVTDSHPELRDRFERLGTALAAAFRPLGAIGVDAVVDGEGTISVLEVNPRPTASMELFERADGTSIAAVHLSACGQAVPVAHGLCAAGRTSGWQWAKAVLFAARDVAVTISLVESLRRTAATWTDEDGGWAALADIPAPGQIIAAGSPACTLFARARRPDDALHILHDRVAAADRLLETSCPGAGPRRDW